MKLKKSIVLWFTGLSGSGKTTISLILKKQLEDKKNMLYNFSLKIKLYSIPIYTFIAFMLILFSSEIYIPILAFIFIVLITIIIRKFFYKN